MNDERSTYQTDSEARAAYEPPQVEKVLRPEDLSREIQYAGLPSQVLEN